VSIDYTFLNVTYLLFSWRGYVDGGLQCFTCNDNLNFTKIWCRDLTDNFMTCFLQFVSKWLSFRCYLVLFWNVSVCSISRSTYISQFIVLRVCSHFLLVRCPPTRYMHSSSSNILCCSTLSPTEWINSHALLMVTFSTFF